MAGEVQTAQKRGILKVAQQNSKQLNKSVDEVVSIRNGAIGRGQAGKTALFRALGEGPVGEYFPSGLFLDVADPKEVAKAIRESEHTRQVLTEAGLPPTVEASLAQYYLYEGDEQRVRFEIREVIGQILTHTVPDSDEEQQARYNEYMQQLLDTHVLWTVIPCPPANPSGRDNRRYMNDLRITNAYLKEVLRHRSIDDRCAVALVLTKLDTLFPDSDDAYQNLTAEVLRRSLSPLVNTIQVSKKVTDAAIFPVSAFGFGNGVLRERHATDVEGDGQDHADFDPFPDEPVWLLREGAMQEPFNLTGLVLWSLMFGMMNQEVCVTSNDREPGPASICRQLMDDFRDCPKWYIPVKGRLSEE